MENQESIQALISIIQGALTQLGIPAVFVLAWWYERREHQKTILAYTRDLRRCGGMSLPEDLLNVVPGASGGD